MNLFKNQTKASNTNPVPGILIGWAGTGGYGFGDWAGVDGICELKVIVYKKQDHGINFSLILKYQFARAGR